MKRGAKRWRFVIAALVLVSLSAAAQQAGAPGAAARVRAAGTKERHGRGAAGRETRSRDAGCRSAQGVSFSAGGHENSAEWLAGFRGDRSRAAVHRRAHGDSHRGQHQRPRRKAGRGADDGKHADPGHGKAVRARYCRSDRFYRRVAGGVFGQRFLDRSSSTS